MLRIQTLPSLTYPSTPQTSHIPGGRGGVRVIPDDLPWREFSALQCLPVCPQGTQSTAENEKPEPVP